MPKRTTLTFTSEDAPKGLTSLLVPYYCKYSGKHAFTLDTDMRKLPKRRTDGSRVIDTDKWTVKLYTTDGPARLVKRKDGRIERQHWLMAGKLPVAYRSEADGQYLYVMHDAVAAYVNQAPAVGDQVLVPPCIMKNSATGATEVRLDVEDRSHAAALVKITADNVRLHIVANLTRDGADQELVTYMAKLLSARLTQVSIKRGTSNRTRLLLVDHLSPEQVYEKLAAHVAEYEAAGGGQRRYRRNFK